MYYRGNVRVRTAYQLKWGMDNLTKQYHHLTTPVVAFHGTHDTVTYIGGVKALLAGCSTADKKVHEIDGGYHVLLEGPEREQVYSNLHCWLASRFPISHFSA